jgi:hypothetical protein
MQGSIQPARSEIGGSLLLDEMLPARLQISLQISRPMLIPVH